MVLDLIIPQPPEAADRAPIPAGLSAYVRTLLREPGLTSDALLIASRHCTQLASHGVLPSCGQPSDWSRVADALETLAPFYAPVPLLRRKDDEAAQPAAAAGTAADFTQ